MTLFKTTLLLGLLFVFTNCSKVCNMQYNEIHIEDIEVCHQLGNDGPHQCVGAVSGDSYTLNEAEWGEKKALGMLQLPLESWGIIRAVISTFCQVFEVCSFDAVEGIVPPKIWINVRLKPTRSRDILETTKRLNEGVF